MQYYTDIFEQRGALHDEAFTRYPKACEPEVQSLLALAAPKSGETLLDLPAAGGFLARYVNVPGMRLIAVEPSPTLHTLCRLRVPESYLAPLHALPLPDASVDVVVCLAGLHHEQQLDAVFREIYRVLRPYGRLAIAEVDAESAAGHFLNGFVDQHNSLGHQGHFVDSQFVTDLLDAGFYISKNQMAQYHWPFSSTDALTDCLRLMFGIDRATPDQILAAVQSELGIDSLSYGKVGMRWSLRHLLAHKGLMV